jgi:hypothetical protein
MEQLIQRYPHMIDNPQVNVFANCGFYQRPTNDEDLRIACARFGSFALCAPVERYDEAMVTLEYFNAPIYAPEGLDFSYIPKNTSTPLKGAHDPRNLLGPALFDWITAMSERDEQLWQFANRELDRRIRAVPNCAERLVAFRQRCRKLKIDYDYVDRLDRESAAAQAEVAREELNDWDASR